jgi:hypothetical protein
LIKLLLSFLLVLIIFAGCIPVIPSSTATLNEPPVAYIDSVSAEGQTVSLSGHGTDVGGTVVAYSWRSDRDGILNKSANFSTTSLSVGNHYIYFKVQDNSGDWSREVIAIINVLPVGMVKPDIKSFRATPESIFDGESTTLTWNVSEALTVNIMPDIGDVSLTGSRLISPRSNTIYTITASNKAGMVKDTARVSVNQETRKILELLSIPEEEGYVDRNGEVGKVAKTGITESGLPMQAFMSFDISMIPPGANILSASLDLTTCMISGYPFNFLGGMGVFYNPYDVLGIRDFKIAFTSDALFLTYTPPTQSYNYAPLASAIQKQADAKNSRFKIRVQFERFNYLVGQGANSIEFVKGKSKLIINYK